jgi:DNA-binding transcriptional regulator YiaG
MTGTDAKNHRNELGISKEAFARHLKISLGSYNRWEATEGELTRFASLVIKEFLNSPIYNDLKAQKDLKSKKKGVKK